MRPIEKSKLSFHKARKQYHARFDGKQVYFGKNHAHAAQRFAEMLTRYENGESVGAPRKAALTVVEAAAKYVSACECYNGPGATETTKIRETLRRLCDLYGREPLGDLSPKRIKTYQTHLIQEDRLTRVGINKALSCVKRFLRWCGSEELCPPSVYHAAQTVEGLRKGRTQARETEPRRPVPIEHVEAVKALGELRSFVAGKNAEALASLEEAGEELIALHGLEVPNTLHRNLLSTNIIENAIRNACPRENGGARQARPGDPVAPGNGPAQTLDGPGAHRDREGFP